MTTTRRTGIDEMIKHGIFAGAAGGLAEIIWVSIYAALTGGDPAILARGVTTAVGIAAVLPATSVAVGVTVHMALALLLGIAVACLWRAMAPRHGVSGAYTAVLAALAAVWLINFFVLLPAIGAAFVHMVPYAVSLTSKVLFGIAAAETLRRFAITERAKTPATAAEPRQPAA